MKKPLGSVGGMDRMPGEVPMPVSGDWGKREEPLPRRPFFTADSGSKGRVGGMGSLGEIISLT